MFVLERENVLMLISACEQGYGGSKCQRPAECNAGFTGDDCEIVKPLSSITIQNVAATSFTAVWQSVGVVGAKYLFALDGEEFTTDANTFEIVALEPKTTYTITVKVKIGALLSTAITRTVTTQDATPSQILAGKLATLFIPVTTFTTILKHSKIVVKFPSNYKISSARRTDSSFTLTNGTRSYQMSSFSLISGNEISGTLDEDLPSGSYTVETRVMGEYSASVTSTQGAVQSVDQSGNVQELAVFNVPQITQSTANDTAGGSNYYLFFLFFLILIPIIVLSVIASVFMMKKKKNPSPSNKVEMNVTV